MNKTEWYCHVLATEAMTVCRNAWGVKLGPVTEIIVRELANQIIAIRTEELKG